MSTPVNPAENWEFTVKSKTKPLTVHSNEPFVESNIPRQNAGERNKLLEMLIQFSKLVL